MKSVKKSEAGTQSFMVTVPEQVDEVVFLLSATAKPPYGLEKHIFWLRARELGSDAWGQTMWAEVHDQEDGLFVSDEIRPRALLLAPETTYEIEVAPETLRVHDLNLTSQIKAKPVERVEVKKPGTAGESVMDNPIFWSVVVSLGLLGYLLSRVIGHLGR